MLLHPNNDIKKKKARQSEELQLAWTQQKVEFKGKQRQVNLRVKTHLKEMDAVVSGSSE